MPKEIDIKKAPKGKCSTLNSEQNSLIQIAFSCSTKHLTNASNLKGKKSKGIMNIQEENLKKKNPIFNNFRERTHRQPHP